MSALAHPSSDGDEDETRFPIVKNQLLPGLRSFCSALKGNCYGKHLASCRNPSLVKYNKFRKNK